MRKLVKGALVAGAAGAGLGAAQAFRRDEPVDVLAQKALKGAGECAALGALVGWFLDRRDRKRVAVSRAKVGAALTTTGLIEAARAARPALEHAVDALSSVADQARPRVEQAVAKPRRKVKRAARKASRKARKRALKAAAQARPVVERAKGAAEQAAERTRGAAEQAAERTREAAEHAAERAREAADQARERAARVRPEWGRDDVATTARVA